MATATALSFFFIAVFGDSASSWTTYGPYRSLETCQRNADGVHQSQGGGFGYQATPSECYAR